MFKVNNKTLERSSFYSAFIVGFEQVIFSWNEVITRFLGTIHFL